jgi:hypothetical protein
MLRTSDRHAKSGSMLNGSVIMILLAGSSGICDIGRVDVFLDMISGRSVDGPASALVMARKFSNMEEGI